MGAKTEGLMISGRTVVRLAFNVVPLQYVDIQDPSDVSIKESIITTTVGRRFTSAQSIMLTI